MIAYAEEIDLIPTNEDYPLEEERELPLSLKYKDDINHLVHKMEDVTVSFLNVESSFCYLKCL